MTLKHEFDTLRKFLAANGFGGSADKEGLELSTSVTSWKSLDELCVVAGGAVPSEFRQRVFELVVPPKGFSIRTKLQRGLGYGSILLGIAIGGGAVYIGGLGLVGPALEYVSAGEGLLGWATIAGTIAGCGGAGINHFLASRLRNSYRFLLDDVVSLYGGNSTFSDTEMKVEHTLLNLHGQSRRMRNITN